MGENNNIIRYDLTPEEVDTVLSALTYLNHHIRMTLDNEEPRSHLTVPQIRKVKEDGDKVQAIGKKLYDRAHTKVVLK